MKCSRCNKVEIPTNNRMCLSCAWKEVDKEDREKFKVQKRTIEKMYIEYNKLNQAYNDAIENNIALGDQIEKLKAELMTYKGDT